MLWKASSSAGAGALRCTLNEISWRVAVIDYCGPLKSKMDFGV